MTKPDVSNMPIIIVMEAVKKLPIPEKEILAGMDDLISIINRNSYRVPGTGIGNRPDEVRLMFQPNPYGSQKPSSILTWIFDWDRTNCGYHYWSKIYTLLNS